MNAFVLLFTLTAVILDGLLLMVQATPMLVHPTMSPTSSSKQHHVSMNTYTAMVTKVVHVQQTIGQLLRENSSSGIFNFTAAQAQRFKYCFLKDVANPPSSNLTVRNIPSYLTH